MKLFLMSVSAALLWLAIGQGPVSYPSLNAFMVSPTRTDQCTPVRVSAMLANKTPVIMRSQYPFSGSTYRFDQSVENFDTGVQNDTYMLAVSLNGGNDGYPYRWGFRGTLAPGRSTTVEGLIALADTGPYRLTTVLMQGDTVIPGASRTSTVEVYLCPDSWEDEPELMEAPVEVFYYGRRYDDDEDMYEVDDHVLLNIEPFAYRLGGRVTVLGGQRIRIQTPGGSVELYRNSNTLIFNGRIVRMPISTYVRGGNVYASPRFLAPLLGANVFYESPNRRIFIDSAWRN